MKVTINWLNEYVDLSGLSVEEIAEALTMAGLEVEVVLPMGRELESLVVGEVLEVEKHPEADKLTLCEVDDRPGPGDHRLRGPQCAARDNGPGGHARDPAPLRP